MTKSANSEMLSNLISVNLDGHIKAAAANKVSRINNVANVITTFYSPNGFDWSEKGARDFVFQRDRTEISRSSSFFSSLLSLSRSRSLSAVRRRSLCVIVYKCLALSTVQYLIDLISCKEKFRKIRQMY
jgi:hypothetical protein